MIVQLRVLGERFQLYCSINWCFMHQATIGLVGHHIVPSIIYKIRKLLRNDLYTKGLTAEGNPRYLISEAMLDEVFTRLCRRLQEYQSSYAGFQLTPKYTAHFKRVFLEGKSTFTASRLELLMIALPSVLRDLIPQEIEFIKLAIKNKQVDVVDGRMPEPPEDPCPEIVNCLACFLDWYMMARLLLFPMEETPELQRRAFVMKGELQRVFPDKTGEVAKWNFPKMHSPEKTGPQIITFATTPYTDTSMFEGAHKQNIKAFSGNSNGKDQYRIIAGHHDRTSCLTTLKHCISRHARFMSRDKESDNSDSGSSSQSDDDDDDDDICGTDPFTSRPCEMAARMPLWERTYDIKALRREPLSLGKRGQGRQRIVIAACKPGAPAPSNRGKVSGTKFLYNHAMEFPNLKYLSAQLGHFAYEYLHSRLGLEYLPEEERDINGVLDSCQVHDCDATDIFTFGGIAIRSLHHKGTVRVRARPLPATNFSDKIRRYTHAGR